jgi:hypothetical protein
MDTRFVGDEDAEDVTVPAVLVSNWDAIRERFLRAALELAEEGPWTPATAAPHQPDTATNEARHGSRCADTTAQSTGKGSGSAGGSPTGSVGW